MPSASSLKKLFRLQSRRQKSSRLPRSGPPDTSSSALYAQVRLENQSDIRLLSFMQEDHFHAPLHTTLEVVDLSDSPKFATLSYFVGPPVFDHAIQVENTVIGRKHEFELSITATLYRALERLRSHGVQRVWIDQICINQRDIEERNSQILLMTTIYGQSSYLLLYIGEFDDAPQVEHSSVKSLLDLVNRSSWPRQDDALTSYLSSIQNRSTRSSSLSNEPNGGTPPNVIAASSAWASIMRRPLFTRKWIIQEIVQSLEALYELAPQSESEQHKLEEHYIRYVKFIKTMITWHQDEDDEQGMSLMQLLKLSRFFHATDERDLVFSILGLACDARDFPSPDYGSTVTTVFTNLSKAFLKQSELEAVLELAGMQVSNPSLASWVIDWRFLEQTYTPQIWRICHASNGRTSFHFIEFTQTISTKGRLVGQVKYTTSAMEIPQVGDTPLEHYLRVCLLAFRRYFETEDDDYVLIQAALALLAGSQLGKDKASACSYEKKHSVYHTDFDFSWREYNPFDSSNDNSSNRAEGLFLGLITPMTSHQTEFVQESRISWQNLFPRISAAMEANEGPSSSLERVLVPFMNLKAKTVSSILANVLLKEIAQMPDVQY
ncbi:MAG: hypothetical protein Q9157_006182 [Trypethelium eluteriae]